MDIAIIDSGILDNLVSSSANIKNKKNFIFDYKIGSIISKECSTCNKHGTYVINTIEKYNKYKNIYYHIINIIDNNGLGNSLSLIEALKYIETIDSIKIIVMSLTFSSKKNKLKIEHLCNNLMKQGKIIVAADSNNSSNAIPASFKSVLGIGRGAFKSGNMFSFSKNNLIQCKGDILPEFVKLKNGHSTLFKGTSKATAKIIPTIIDAIYNGASNFQQVENYLSKHSDCSTTNILPVLEHISLIDYNDKLNTTEVMTLKSIIKYINEFSNSKKINYCTNKLNNIFFTELLDDVNKLDSLLEFIAFKLNLKIDVENISFFNFKTLFDIVRYFEDLI